MARLPAKGYLIVYLCFSLYNTQFFESNPETFLSASWVAPPWNESFSAMEMHRGGLGSYGYDTILF